MSDRGDDGDENGLPWLALLPVNVADGRNRSPSIVARLGQHRDRCANKQGNSRTKICWGTVAAHSPNWTPAPVQPSSFSNEGLRLLAASERELTDRTLYVEFEPRHFCKQLDIASADGTATKAQVGRRQVE